MFAAGFHAASFYRPDLRGHIDLVPARAKYLARACRRQNRELKRQRRDGFDFAQLGDESRNPQHRAWPCDAHATVFAALARSAPNCRAMMRDFRRTAAYVLLQNLTLLP